MGKEIILEKRLVEDIQAFCVLNEIDANVWVNELLKKAFMEEKWLQPSTRVGNIDMPKVKQLAKPIFDDVEDLHRKNKMQEIVDNLEIKGPIPPDSPIHKIAGEPDINQRIKKESINKKRDLYGE